MFCFYQFLSLRNSSSCNNTQHFNSSKTFKTTAVCPCFVVVFSSPPTKAVASSPLTLCVCFAVFLLSLHLSLVWTLRLIIQRKFKNLLFHILHIFLWIDGAYVKHSHMRTQNTNTKNFTLFLLSSSANLGHNTWLWRKRHG